MKTLLLLLPTLLIADLRANPALTIYDQDFAVVRETIPSELQAGINDIKFYDIPAALEPHSVMLRDPSGKTELQILEQSFRKDTVNQQMMLSRYEGKEIDFLVKESEKPDRFVKGKVIRSGDPLLHLGATSAGGGTYEQSQARTGALVEPIIEVDGQLQFRLPGVPLFPALTDHTILKPELSWKLASSNAGQLELELSYISSGLTWEAHYNAVASETGGKLDLTGWVVLTNHSGKGFEDASVKLMAGDVNRNQPEERMRFAAPTAAVAQPAVPPATEKSFDDYHLYTLPRPLSLRDGESKQVEFVRAANVNAERFYIYDGAIMDWSRSRAYDANNLRQNENLGVESNAKVSVMREFKNSKENGLGVPLPRGQLRFYQRDEDDQLEFVGENNIGHTPTDETVRVSVGTAFDIVGERKRTAFEVDSSNNWADESFEIKLRNRKKEAVEVRVVEHLFRSVNWEIRQHSEPFISLDAQKIEFRVKLAPDEEKKLTYLVHYSW